MNENAANMSDERRCPVCEYDLRGNTSGRCPECGTVVLSAASSRLPWLYQRARGGIRAYMQTVALLLFKPRQLATEVRQRIQRQPAHRFHHESMALATFLGSGFFAVVFLLRGAKWDPILAPPLESYFQSPQNFLSWVRLPTLVWTDRLIILIPVLPALYFSLRMIAWCYRLFFRSGSTESPHAQRRAARLACYGSGLAPVMATLVGTTGLLRIVQSDEWTWAVGGWLKVIWIAWLLLILAMPIVFYYPTLTLLALAGKATRWRMIAMVVLMPVISVAVLAATTVTMFWTLGYVAMAVWSMTH